MTKGIHGLLFGIGERARARTEEVRVLSWKRTVFRYAHNSLCICMRSAGNVTVPIYLSRTKHRETRFSEDGETLEFGGI